MENRIAKNRTSPKNESAYIDAYKSMNPKATRKDDLDVAAVVTKGGERGHALLSQEKNRSHDSNYHRVQDFISDRELKKNI